MAFSVFRPSSRGRKSRFYSAKVKLEDWPRPRVFALRTQDKTVAQEKARALVNDLEWQNLKLPSFSALRKAAGTPIAPHLAAYLAEVEGRGRAPETVRVYRVALGQLCKCSEWNTPGDITGASFVRWRNSEGVKSRYANNVLGYARTFCTWLVKRRVLAVNPLADLEKIRIRQDRGARYVPTVEQLLKLLETVPRNRAIVYLFVIYTGLRRSEVDGLTCGDFDLKATPPTVRVPGSISKNGKTEILPLRPELVEAIKEYLPDLSQPFEWVFRNRVPTYRTFRKDILAAGIPARDEYGRKFDFHALRTTFGTLLSASGVAPRVAMHLMRHSEMKLTMKTYMDASHLPLMSSLASLPSLSLPEKHTSNSAQTADFSGQNGVTPDASCHFLASDENRASVSNGPSSSIPDASGEAGKMVGLVRFEQTNTPEQVTNVQELMENQTMPHASNSVTVQFRQKLAELDAARRQLLLNAFIGYEGETTELLSLLISEANPATLVKLEAKLTKEGQG